MSLQLIEGHDAIKVENVVIHVFSDPGVGKSTLANMGRKVLLIDFDGGAHRSLGRQRVVRFERWSDLEELLKHPWLDEAETLALDTVGRGLDMLSDEIIGSDAKLGTPLGGLNQRGWGAMKQRFITFFSTLRRRRKDVLLLSHAKIEKDKEGNKAVYPDIVGGSAGEVFKVSDAMAYYALENGRRVLDFNATDAHIGKNPPAWPKIVVPDYATATTFLADKILRPLKDHLNALSDEQVKVLKLVSDWQALIEGLDATPAALTAQIAKVSDIAHEAVRAQAKTLLWRRAKALGLEFDQPKRAFFKPTAPASAHEQLPGSPPASKPKGNAKDDRAQPFE